MSNFLPRDYPLSTSMSEKITVLLIEDDDVDRQAVHRLAGSSCRFVDAATGLAGLELRRSCEPDCVLLDYCLPDIDGLDLLKRLSPEETPVVMLTGQGNEAVAVSAMKHGAADYLSKQALGKEALRRTIQNAVERIAMQRQILQQQAELQHRAVELQRSNEELHKYAYVVSHDLQEPLRSVRKFCTVLKRNYGQRVDAQGERWMDKIVGGAERMQAMIRDLLAYSRIDLEGRTFSPTDCNQVFDEVIAGLRAAVDEAEASVTRDELPTLPADRSQLCRLFQNLIANALKYRGDKPPVVHVSAHQDGKHWTFTVADNGIGIAPEHHDRIFQMFRRLHSSQAYSGTGIGLALCQRIVQRHGGRIWVQSRPNAGSIFHFTL